MLRYLLCICLVLSGCASTKQSAYIDQPVRVTGEGRTFDEAKKNAFSNAMEYAVGAVVVTETQVQRRRLVKDDIIKHSAGYVDDFTVINRVDEPNRVTVVMDVKVKHSAIAERITNVQSASGELQGQRVDGMYSSFLQTKQTGDQLLSQVLDDYPKHAFNVEKGSVQYMLNINRLPVLIVPYKITWNYKYLQALNEALDATKDPKDRLIKQQEVHVQSKNPSAWLVGSTDKYYFNDEIRADMVKKSLGRMIYVIITLKDDQGNILNVSCDNGNSMAGTYQNGVFVVEGNRFIHQQGEQTFVRGAEKLKRMTTVEVTVGAKPCTFIH